MLSRRSIPAKSRGVTGDSRSWWVTHPPLEVWGNSRRKGEGQSAKGGKREGRGYGEEYESEKGKKGGERREEMNKKRERDSCEREGSNLARL